MMQFCGRITLEKCIELQLIHICSRIFQLKKNIATKKILIQIDRRESLLQVFWEDEEDDLMHWLSFASIYSSLVYGYCFTNQNILLCIFEGKCTRFFEYDYLYG